MMDALDLQLLAFLSTKENHTMYSEYINKGLCTKYSWNLIKAFGEYFDKHPNSNEIDTDFTLWFRVDKYPNMKPDEHEFYGKIVTNVEQKRSDGVSDEFVSTLMESKTKQELSVLVQDIQEGKKELDEFMSQATQIISNAETTTGSTDTLVNMSLEDLSEHTRDDEGYYWRCEDLNQAIGPIRQGDLIVIGKRPEVGGTSFVCSELAHMFEQLDGKDAIIFNNEEAPDKVYTRLVSAALGVDYRTLITNAAQYDREFKVWLDGRRFDIEHDTQMSVASIRNRLQKGNYGLIGVNVLLKVKGTGKLEDHDKLQFLGEEMRRIAQDYGPVYVVTQADPSAEGVKYIHQDRLYKSKTAIQGEADVLLMIGKDHDEPDDVRFFNVAKNKIPPAKCCDLTCKHLMSEVHFALPTGRFSSKLFSGNSRWKN